MKKDDWKWNKAVTIVTTCCLLGLAGICMNTLQTQAAQNRQVEALDRGLVAVKSGTGVYLSWRLLGTESYDTAFYVYRNGTKIAGPITDSTNYQDTEGTLTDIYYVRTVMDGVEKTQSDSVSVWENNYKDVPIEKPGDIYSANDATVADVDGDGAYEIILKWNPSDAQDNSKSGYTSNVYIDCYEMDGTKKWRIDLGKNIRAGAHYTQFIAYDLNGDGKAEVAMKTADGTVDGVGTLIGDASADYRNSDGYILEGPEYLTLFEGETGKIIHTIDYEPKRGKVKDWGDDYGNRVDRFLATVAYLDGKTPSLIMCRGYYTRSVLVAYQYKDGELKHQWTFDSNDSGNEAYYGQGNHNLTSADVDGDGKDEIVYGSCVIDHDGTGLYSTGDGHGDALHVGDFDPDNEGMEIYQVHEEKSADIESVQMRDAKSGKTLWCCKTGTDVGRGVIANIGPDYYPYVAMSSAGHFDKNGNQLELDTGKFGLNFVVYWDGDLYREGLDRHYINKYNYNTKGIDRLLSASDIHTNNDTKYNVCLSGDIMGDWREEVIWPKADDSALRIYISTAITNHKLYTLVHDVQYREAIAWQNVGYNQPPHTSFYVGEDMETPTKPNVYTVGTYAEKTVEGTESENPDEGDDGTLDTPEISLKEGAILKEGIYTIQNIASGLYLDVTNGVAANATNVQQWGAAEPAIYNTWKIKAVGDGYYQIYSMVGDGSYLLDLDYGKVEDGTNIQIYQNTYADAQLFKFVKNEDGSYTIVTKPTLDQSALTVADGSLENGANICQWSCAGTDNQKWLLKHIPSREEKTSMLKYTFEDMAEGTITDTSANGQNAAIYGNVAIVEDEERGNVLYLDGSNGTYVQFPNGMFDGMTDVTISMNVKSESKGNFFTFTVGQDNTKYYFNNISQTAMRSAITINSWQGESNLSIDLDGTKWHNYTIIISEKTMKVYVDGELQSEVSDVPYTFADLGTNTKAYLGKSFYEADGYFKGYLDNVEIYDYALSTKEVSELAATNFPAPECKHQKKEIRNQSEATYEQDGYSGDTYCVDCDTLLETGTRIPKLENKDEETGGDGSDNNDDPTGGDDSDNNGDSNGNEGGESGGNDDTPQTPSEDETHDCTAQNWTYNEEKHWHICTICEERYEEASHTFSEWMVVKEPTNLETGEQKRTCSICEYEQTETIAKLECKHLNKEIRNQSEATYEQNGYSGDTYCADCDTLIETGTTIPKLESEDKDAETGKEETQGSTGGTEGQTPQNSPESEISLNQVIEVKDKNTTYYYKVTKVDTTREGTVTWIRCSNKKATKIVIPDTIEVQGYTYKVTEIAKNACYNHKNLKQVTIGKNVTMINDNAFSKCTKLKKVIIGKNVKKIGKKAFYKNKNLKEIVIKSKKLKTVGKSAIKGIHKKAQIKVPKAKKAAYTKLFKKSTGFKGSMKIK